MLPWVMFLKSMLELIDYPGITWALPFRLVFRPAFDIALIPPIDYMRAPSGLSTELYILTRVSFKKPPYREEFMFGLIRAVFLGP